LLSIVYKPPFVLETTDLRFGVGRTSKCAVMMASERTSWLETLVKKLSPPALANADDDTRRRARLVILFSFTIFLCGPGYGAVYLALGMPVSTIGAAVAAVILAATPFIQRRTGSARVGAHLVSFGCYAALALVTAPTGGLAAPALAWLALVPVTALMLGGKRAGWIWSVVSVATVIAYFVAQVTGHTPASEAPERWLSALRLTVNAGLVGLIALLAWLYESNKDRMLGEIKVANVALTQARDDARGAHREARLVLDNVAQGLMVADAKGTLLGEQSRAVATLFEKEGAKEIWDLVRESPAFEQRLRLGWEAMFDGVLPLELSLDQMPSSCRMGARTLRFGYVPMLDDSTLRQVLVVVTDDTVETQARELQRDQHEQLEVFQWIMRDREYFVEFYRDAAKLVDHVLCGADTPAELVRAVHTLKGNAGVFGLRSLASVCHELEDHLRDQPEARLDPSQVEKLAAVWLAASQRIDPLLGSSKADSVLIGRAEYEELLAALAERSPAQYERARRWRWESSEVRLTRLSHQAKALSERLTGRKVEVAIETDGARLPPGEWGAFWSSTIHLIRNALDHGIEDADERALLGKPRYGKLTLRACVGDERLVVEFADDGRGIDWNAIRERAHAIGVPASEQRDLVAALFHDGLSTRTEVTETSGRGVGMAAVFAACRGLAGEVEVDSEPGKGTSFRFTFPLRERARAA
jgi:HPt (histidine-containing phosphotransfer) domain-containing protein